MDKLLIINAGSSSMKFQVIDRKTMNYIAKGIAERIDVDGIFNMEYKGTKIKIETLLNNHSDAIKVMLKAFKKYHIIDSMQEFIGIGHRVVQGGEIFKHSSIIDENSVKQIENMSNLAPLHNPAAVAVMKSFFKLIPHAKNVAVFDTSFHQSMPKINYLYATPIEWYKKYNVRRYGMHGTSHKYIVIQSSKILGIEKPNIISCHLGNGASIAAIKEGKCVNTSMGLTPLAGIIMGTRSGDIDPSIIEYMCHQTGKSVTEITNILNKESGVLGLSKVSSDFRELEKAIKQGNKDAAFALDIYAKRVADYIVKYQNELENKVDAIIFTAGIGENSGVVRKKIINFVKTMDIIIDDSINDNFSSQEYILLTKPSSKVKVYMIRTNEESMIVKDLVKLANL